MLQASSLFSGHNHSIIWLLFFGCICTAVCKLQGRGEGRLFSPLPALVLGTGPNWYLVRAKSLSLGIYNRLPTELSMKTARFYLITEDLY